MSDQHPTYLFEEVRAIKEGMLVPVTHYAVGRNGDSESNGIYIKLFNWMPYPAVQIYANEFWQLPKEWKPMVDDALVTGSKIKPKKTSVASDREDAEDKKLLKPLPVAGQIVRYQFDGDSPDANAKRWRFHAVYKFWHNYKPKAEAENTVIDINTPPTFKSKDDALDWALTVGAFEEKQDAETAYNVIKADKNPKNSGEMFTYWIEHVQFLHVLINRERGGG